MKITKYFALLCAAASLSIAGCELVDDNTNGTGNENTNGTGNENNSGENNDENNGENNGNENNGDSEATIVLGADKTTIELGETITFTVTEGDNDVTADCTIYDKDMSIIEGNTYTAETTGTFSFLATMGSKVSNRLYISVLASVPVLPEDTDEANTKFNHRILLVDHTGVNCGYCPWMTDNLIAFHNKTSWGNNCTEVTCHAGSMAGGDPANSPAANIVNQFYSPNGYPNLSVNFYTTTVGNDFEAPFLADMESVFSANVKKDGADAGIAIATTGDSDKVYATVAVKAAVEQEYKITAWLLENNIYSKNQAGASKPEHYIYDHALRFIPGKYDRNNIQGESFGIIKAGQTISTGFELDITSTMWNSENLEVIVIVSAQDKSKRWEVVNTLTCPVNQSVNFEYLK